MTIFKSLRHLLSAIAIGALSVFVSATTQAADETPVTPAAKAAVQFFGDTYLPAHVITQTESSAADPKLFHDVKPLLDAATFNVVNFEGVATTARIPHEFKQYLLRMPKDAAAILASARISVATLANNHAFDYGYQGLFDSLLSLREAGIATTGAGRNLDEATRPVILPGGDSGSSPICIYAFTRVLPSSFWATQKKSGTAYSDVASMAKLVRECANSGYFTIVTFHWGEELSKTPQPYQSYIAKQMIDAGAQAVIGHHPHLLQPIEVYAGRPIIHSLGNFAFGTMPRTTRQNGMAAAFHISGGGNEIKAVLTPLNVTNSQVNYKPRPLRDGEKDPLAALIPANLGCVWDKVQKNWTCIFKKTQS